MASKGRLLAKVLVDSAGDISSGSLDNVSIADGSITTAKLESSVQSTLSSAVLKNSSTGAASLPSGTTAQRPGTPIVGMTRMNTSTGSIEFYDGSSWISTNLIPTINSITGTIYVGIATSLVMSLTNATENVTVRFSKNGITLSDVSSSVTTGSTTVTVPSAVYTQSNGDSIAVSILNQDGTPSSNAVIKTLVALPSGGTASISNGYRYHTFTSSSSLSVPSGFSATAHVLVVGGGGGGGATRAGGGGAGGLIDTTLSLSSGTYTVTIGGGGTGGNYNSNTQSYNGSSSSITGITTAIGGGRGASRQGAVSADSGGSGGGGGCDNGAYGNGTAGQGNNGGAGTGGAGNTGGGGGGAGAVGQSYVSSSQAGAGGVGINWKSLGTHYAGGGGGGGGAASSPGAGGNGGGGNGAAGGGANSNPGFNATTNTGGGGGGGGDDSNGGNGGSGIVIVRYQL